MKSNLAIGEEYTVDSKQKTVVCLVKTLLHEAMGFRKGIWPGLRAFSGFQASWSKRLHFVTFAGKILPAPTMDRL